MPSIEQQAKAVLRTISLVQTRAILVLVQDVHVHEAIVSLRPPVDNIFDLFAESPRGLYSQIISRR